MIDAVAMPSVDDRQPVGVPFKHPMENDKSHYERKGGDHEQIFDTCDMDQTRYRQDADDLCRRLSNTQKPEESFPLPDIEQDRIQFPVTGVDRREHDQVPRKQAKRSYGRIEGDKDESEQENRNQEENDRELEESRHGYAMLQLRVDPVQCKRCNPSCDIDPWQVPDRLRLKKETLRGGQDKGDCKPLEQRVD